MSAQAQKFWIFQKRSVWVAIVNAYICTMHVLYGREEVMFTLLHKSHRGNITSMCLVESLIVFTYMHTRRTSQCNIFFTLYDCLFSNFCFNKFEIIPYTNLPYICINFKQFWLSKGYFEQEYIILWKLFSTVAFDMNGHFLVNVVSRV